MEQGQWNKTLNLALNQYITKHADSLTYCFNAGCKQINSIRGDHIDCDVCLGSYCIECKVNSYIFRWNIIQEWLVNRLKTVEMLSLRNIWRKMESEDVQMINVKFQLSESMVVTGLLALDVVKVCVSNVNLTKWLRTTTTQIVTIIWVKFMEDTSDTWRTYK